MSIATDTIKRLLTGPMTTMTHAKLRPEVKAKWLAALRSGDYRQGQGLLHQISDGQHSFCCLGVLCDLAEKEGVIAGRPTRDGSFTPVSYDDLISIPPPGVAAWAYDDFKGADRRSWLVRSTDQDANAGLCAEDDVTALVDLNDLVGLSFAEIADRIEADL